MCEREKERDCVCAFVCLREIGSVVWAQGAACESVPRGAIYGDMSGGGEAAQRFEHRLPRSVEGVRENVRARAAAGPDRLLRSVVRRALW